MPIDHTEYKRLARHAVTEQQLTRLKNVFELGSERKAAKLEGVNKNAVHQTIQLIKKRAIRMGDTKEWDEQGLAAPGNMVSGKSILYDAEGNIKLQWVKTKEDITMRQELIALALSEAAEGLKGLAPAVIAPKKVDSDLIAIYPYGDPHIGMYAWKGDAEEDHDLDKAVALLTNATTRLVAGAPSAEQALIVLLGDFYHADNQLNRTMRSGHALDVDSRWAKVFRTGVMTCVSLIQLALQKHKQVHVICEIGNHDDHSALALGVSLDMFFSDEPRVTIDTSAQRFHYYRFGENLIGVHHGDLVKPAALPQLMAADRPEDWGKSRHRVWYTGHIHNQTRYDLAGCEVESFRILPPRDAWAQSMGYRGGRSMDCIIRHRTRGEISRHTVHAAEIQCLNTESKQS